MPGGSSDSRETTPLVASEGGTLPSPPPSPRGAGNGKNDNEASAAAAAVASRAPLTLSAALVRAASGPQALAPALCQERLHVDTLKPNAPPRTLTWAAFHAECRRAARALIALGLKPGEAACVVGFNAPEWVIADLGAILAGGLACGVYATNSAEQCLYIAKHCDARVAVCDGAKQLLKFVGASAQSHPKLAALVCYDARSDDMRLAAEAVDDLEAAREEAASPAGPACLTWIGFMALGDAPDEAAGLEAALEARTAALRPESCCTLIYTSGTTGPPKGVMVSHDNALWTCEAGLAHHAELANEGFSCRVVSFLPLSHIAAQVTDIFAPIFYAGTRGLPSTTYFARPDALKGSLRDTLLLARPTLFFGVPRVWTKFQEGMLKVGKAVPAPLRWLSAWAKWVGKADYDARVSGQSPVRGCQWWLADKLVFSSIRRALGLDKCRLLVSGAAPVPLDTLAYFGSVGMHLLEVYGMSENSGPAIMGRNHLYAPGSIGLPLPATELRLDHVEGRDRKGEGELLMRGRHIMLGYLHDEVKTRGAIDEDGWLHSGDVCSANPKTGALYITGRIKELLITEGGENVAPVPIEDKLKELLPAVSNVMVIGDKRKYLTCLVTLHQRGSELEGFEDELAGESRRLFKGVTTVAAAASSRGWSGYLMTGLSAYNQTHAVSNAQRVQKFAIVPDFDVPSGLMTATLKMQRPKILQHYEALIDDTLYGGAKAA